MQKSRAPALDLADRDIVEDDCDLVVGPLIARLSLGSCAGGGRQLGGASFKDTSILGSAALASKLSPSASVPTPSALSRGPSARLGSNGVYCEGTPIIATANPSRPMSGALRQPRLSAPCGNGGSSASDLTDAPSQSRSVHGACSGDRAAVEAPDGGLESRIQGDIQGGDSDDSTTPNTSEPLRKRREGHHNKKAAAATAKSPTAAARPAGGGDASADIFKAASDKNLTAAGGSGAGAGNLPSRGSCEGAAVGKAGALPSVDVEAERRQKQTRSLDAAGCQPAVLAVQPKSSAAAGKISAAAAVPARDSSCGLSSGGPTGAAVGGKDGAARTAKDAGHAPAASEPPLLSTAISVDKGIVRNGEAMDKPASGLQRTPSGRFLSRLLTGSHVSPAGAEKGRQQQTAARNSGWTGEDVGAGADCSGKETGSGLRHLFSRPSSARRKSEVGPPPAVLQQTSMSSKQLRHSHHGQTEAAAEEAAAAAASIGGGRQPSGILTRTASAIAAAWGR